MCIRWSFCMKGWVSVYRVGFFADGGFMIV